MAYELISLKPATDGKKKYMVKLKNKATGREKTIKFGAKGMDDFTKTKDVAQKERYIQRHQKNESWTNPATAGFWSKNLLWNKPTVSASLADIKKKYF
tara:strand:- start:321 stop:614 length:294 start_codon:yes stop_codon:yes gene_type:complete